MTTARPSWRPSNASSTMRASIHHPIAAGDVRSRRHVTVPERAQEVRDAGRSLVRGLEAEDAARPQDVGCATRERLGHTGRDERRAARGAPRPATRARATRRRIAPCASSRARVRRATRHPRVGTGSRHAGAPLQRCGPRPERSCRSSLEGAPPVLGGERLGEIVQLAVEGRVEPVLRELDPVVGDAILGEVVGADLLRPLARADLRPPRRLLLLALLRALELVEPRPQHAHRLRLVLELRLLVLHRDDDACGHVRDAHSRVGRVHALAARAGRAVDVDLQVVRVDLHLDLLDLGHHGDRCRRGVDAALRLRLRDTLHAVRAALPLEDGVRPVTLDPEHDFLETAGLVRARSEHFALEAAPLRVAGEHPVEVARPQRRLVAADALADLDEHVLAVGRIGLDERELQLLLEAREPLLELGYELAQVTVAVRVREVGANRAPLLGQPVRGLELLQAAPDLRRLAMVVVDGRVGHALLRLPVRALDFLDELVDSGHATKGSAGSKRVLTAIAELLFYSRDAISTTP